ncbi:MAG TPA: NUDIX domain-containing protein [Pseudoneobacillus sp.]|uniref:NUDIX domain-containing protein n=1 Tax=Neobacillus sp. D3-1R TaxID=3445778 RepID=UPI002D71F44C|nr:NUDIX domain-containing protein [Pseudoneobacillus sp.]
MLFDEVFGISSLDESKHNIRYREAVRAVIVRDGQILLIHSNKGDYKFPGGGVEKGESHDHALLREIAEETGYINAVVKNKIGVVVERQIDEYVEEPNAYFQMTSHYYVCDLIDEEKVALKLEGYESIQQFTPKWVTIEEAIKENHQALTQPNPNDWIQRESYVLSKLVNGLNVE